MTPRELVNEMLPKWQPTPENGYLFGFTQNNYEVAKENMVSITAELIHKGADPEKLRKIYFDIITSIEGQQSILNIFEAVHRLHDISIAYLYQLENDKNNLGDLHWITSRGN